MKKVKCLLEVTEKNMNETKRSLNILNSEKLLTGNTVGDTENIRYLQKTKQDH